MQRPATSSLSIRFCRMAGVAGTGFTAVPAVGIAAFIWDGIFIGATATRGMLLSMAAAAVSFFILYYGLHPVLANHALWLAFLTYLLMRGVVQTGLSREVIRRAFPSKKEPAWREGQAMNNFKGKSIIFVSL